MIQTRITAGLTITGRITTLILLASSLVLFTQCKRTSKDDELLGTQYKPASENFSVINGSSGFQAYRISDGNPIGISTVDFTSDSIFFKAKFSESVTWTLNITGLESGAVKTLTGLSDTLNVSNSIWDGGHTGFSFFQAGEEAVAEITFLGSSLSYKDTIEIFAAKQYHQKKINGVRNIVIEDYENAGGIKTFAETFHDLGDDPFLTYGLNTSKKVNGTYSYYMAGPDVNSNTWLVGQNTTFDGFLGIQNDVLPENLYVNAYVYGTGKANTTLQFKLYEMDSGMPSPSVTYNQAVNDGYVFDQAIDWTGWKLVSIRYSSFRRGNDPLYGGNGNGIMQPGKVVGVAVTLTSQPTAGQEVEAYVDYVVLTENGKFNP